MISPAWPFHDSRWLEIAGLKKDELCSISSVTGLKREIEWESLQCSIRELYCSGALQLMLLNSEASFAGASQL
jgi:hypothetical protein